MNAATAPAAFRHSEFRASIGVARTDITPPLGIYARLWGSARHDVAIGVHRPLTATAVVIYDRQERSKLVLLSLDVVALWHEENEAIRRAITSAYSLGPAQLILHVSHTHSSPMLARRHFERTGGEHIAPYLDSLPARCVELVAEADAARVDSVLTWAYGHCCLAFNRDAVDHSSGRGVCGLNPARTADDTILVGRVTDSDRRVRCTLVNYACHPVSLGGGNQRLSPDYPGSMRELVERETGGTCVFLHGASGDLTPRLSYESDVEAAEVNGRELGYAVLATLTGMLPPSSELAYAGVEESGTALGVWHCRPRLAVPDVLSAVAHRLMLPLKTLPPREDILARIAAKPPAYELERLERMLAMRERIGKSAEGPLLVTVWRLGDAFIVATTGEAYSKFQLDLRARFAGRAVAVLNLSNGATSYLPEHAAYDADNYPARVTEYAPGGLERTTSSAIDLLDRLIAGQPP